MLILDCATSHLDRATEAHLRRPGVLVVIIPAKMTWLLQALDVYAFGKLKRGLREAEAWARVDEHQGKIPPGPWMRLGPRQSFDAKLSITTGHGHLFVWVLVNLATTTLVP